jgi:hypothetical protein
MMLSAKTWLGAARAAAGYSAPLIPFTSFPAALTVEGQIRRPAELPHVSLIALGGIWRPLGGRQVLASRMLNPVRVQDTTVGGVEVESIGPFPGGLVRAGMRLDLKARVNSSALSTSLRSWFLKINSVSFRQYQTNISAAKIEGYIQGGIDVLLDGFGPHSPFLFINSDEQRMDVSNIGNFNADFSAPWSAYIYATSAAETAVTITGATWSAGVATYTTSVAHTLAVGDKDVVSGITPSGYNGTFIVSAVGSPTTFSVPMAVDPGTWVSGPGSSSRISNMILQSYVLELIG